MRSFPVYPFFFLVLFLTPLAAIGQGNGLLYIDRIDGEIVLDGTSDEPAWEAIQPLPLVQYEPRYGEPASERTEIRFGYDSEFLYISLRAFDKDQDGIRANTLYRDRLSGDDHLEILLDTFNDNENAVLFTTNPAGLRRDAAVRNDASGGGITSGSWLSTSFNTFWDVQTQVTPEGWFAEVRIPFSSLRFQEENGEVTMGMSVQRKVARRSERLIFPDVPPYTDWAFLKPSNAQKIVFRGIYPTRPLYITPYALTGQTRTAPLNDAGNAYTRATNRDTEIGADIKYVLTNNLTLDLTANTDFAQAEADDQQINLTRFSLFFPEKRPFFQERAGIFEFGTGGLSRLFHSRRIGLTASGTPVRLLGGARLVGRAGPWDLGFMSIQSADEASLPSENFGVMRVRRQAFNEFSYVGAMLTSRLANVGQNNVAYGVDGVIRLVGDEYLTVQWAQTFDESFGSSQSNSLGNTRLTAEIERRRRDGFGYRLGAIWAGPHYNPGIGFVQRRDFTLWDNTLSYTWFPGNESNLIFHTLESRQFTFVRHEDGKPESIEISPAWSFSNKTLSSGGVSVSWLYEDLLEGFALSPSVNVPAGTHKFVQGNVYYRMPFTALWQIHTTIAGGTFFDGWRGTLELTPTLYVSKHLELSGSYSFNRVRFPDRNQEVDFHLARLRIGTALNTSLSVNSFIQYSSLQNVVSANIRFRYNFREGNDLWIVFNQSSATDRYDVMPALPPYRDQTLLLKYTHTFHVEPGK